VNRQRRYLARIARVDTLTGNEGQRLNAGWPDGRSARVSWMIPLTCVSREGTGAARPHAPFLVSLPNCPKSGGVGSWATRSRLLVFGVVRPLEFVSVFRLDLPVPGRVASASRQASHSPGTLKQRE
jgi:hypothetical protein